MKFTGHWIIKTADGKESWRADSIHECARIGAANRHRDLKIRYKPDRWEGFAEAERLLAEAAPVAAPLQ